MHISHCTEQITLYYLYGYSWTQNLRIWKCSWAWTRNHQVGKHCQWKISHHNSKRRRSRTRCNLISISRALETGIEVLFASKSVKFRAPNKVIIMEGTMLNRLFEMNIKGIIKPDLACPAKTGKTWDEWHRIFGHMHI